MSDEDVLYQIKYRIEKFKKKHKHLWKNVEEDNDDNTSDISTTNPVSSNSVVIKPTPTDEENFEAALRKALRKKPKKTKQ